MNQVFWYLVSVNKVLRKYQKDFGYFYTIRLRNHE